MTRLLAAYGVDTPWLRYVAATTARRLAQSTPSARDLAAGVLVAKPGRRRGPRTLEKVAKEFVKYASGQPLDSIAHETATSYKSTYDRLTRFATLVEIPLRPRLSQK